MFLVFLVILLGVFGGVFVVFLCFVVGVPLALAFLSSENPPTQQKDTVPHVSVSLVLFVSSCRWVSSPLCRA